MRESREFNPRQFGNFLQILKDLRGILSFLPERERLKIGLLVIIQILGGFAEMLSLGAILPFISAITNAGVFLARPEFQPIAEMFDINNEQELIVFVSIVFITAFVFVNVFKLFTFWVQAKVGVSIGNVLSQRFFSKILHQDFEYHLNTNSGILISRIITDLSCVLHFIGHAMTISTQGFAITAIIFAITYYNPTAAMTIFASILVLYYMIAKSNKKKLIKNGEVLSNSHAAVVHNLQVALGGIRDVIMGDKYAQFIHHFTASDKSLRSASARTQILTVMPRYFIEVIVVSILAAIAAYYALYQGGVFDVLPLIGALAMAAIRVLPAAQMLYYSFAGMQSVHVSVERVLKILDLPLQTSEIPQEYQVPAPQKSMDLSDVWFRFKGGEEASGPSDWVLKGVELSIPLNKTIALVGKTGGGKTTISDIVAGLLYAEKGNLSVDGHKITKDKLKSWRRHVAYVPQSIFLLDATVKENIAFGENPEEIDLQRVKKACAMAQIDDLIESRPKQYDEIIGENGLKLSGGQRQRIGLARALYKDAQLLVLDEATSALDNETEHAVMQTITSLRNTRTLLVIAHRLDTIKKADLIYEIQDGQVVAQGTYQELMESSRSFKQIALAAKKE